MDKLRGLSWRMRQRGAQWGEIQKTWPKYKGIVVFDGIDGT